MAWSGQSPSGTTWATVRSDTTQSATTINPTRASGIDWSAWLPEYRDVRTPSVLGVLAAEHQTALGRRGRATIKCRN